MANSASAKKRARQSEVRRELNKGHRSRYRTYVKQVRAAVEEGDSATAQAAFKTSVSVIAKMVTKGILPKNTAARLTSRLNAAVKAMAA